MRTKTLILSVLLGAAGVSSSLAQSSVYSLNAVGYVNVTCPPGFSLIANPLNTTNNSLNSLLPYNNGAIPVNTQIFKYGASGYQIATMDEFDLVWVPNLTLDPGEGAFFKNTEGANKVLTFVGEVLQGKLTNSIPSGYSIRSSKVPQEGTLGASAGGVNLLVPGQPNDQVFKYTPSGYVISTFDEFDLVWVPNVTIKVGESFFVKKSAPDNTWIRDFSANN
jgi:hypothetical protein